MVNILHDLSTSSLINAIDENLISIYLTFRNWPKAEIHDETAIKWSITDIPFPLFNSIFHAQLVPEKIDVTIQSIIAQAKLRKVPLLWWTGPATQPIDLGKHLERHGFIREEQMPGMAVDLANLRENLPMPAAFNVQPVGDDATLKQWSQVMGAGFGLPDFAAEAIYDLSRHVVSETMRDYLGLLNDKPVATSTLFLAAGVAGIYNVATIPEARRQGIGAMMTTFPLREARRMGYRAGILQASEMGVGVYQSIGFQEYFKIGQYVWEPDHTQAG